MRHLPIIVSVLFLLHISSPLFSQNVRVIFINKTGLPIDSLIANDVYVGSLKPDSASRIVSYESLTLGSGHGISGTGIMHTTHVKSLPDFPMCGMGEFTTVTSGDYLYHIQRRYIDSKHYILFEPAPRVAHAEQE